jgi:hypothetical protein
MGFWNGTVLPSPLFSLLLTSISRGREGSVDLGSDGWSEGEIQAERAADVRGRRTEKKRKVKKRIVNYPKLQKQKKCSLAVHFHYTPPL